MDIFKTLEEIKFLVVALKAESRAEEGHSDIQAYEWAWNRLLELINTLPNEQ